MFSKPGWFGKTALWRILQSFLGLQKVICYPSTRSFFIKSNSPSHLLHLFSWSGSTPMTHWVLWHCISFCISSSVSGPWIQRWTILWRWIICSWDTDFLIERWHYHHHHHHLHWLGIYCVVGTALNSWPLSSQLITVATKCIKGSFLFPVWR